MKTQTVAAAISAIAEAAMADAGVADSNSDAIATIMNDAQRTIANELARQGMSLKDAIELAEDAALRVAAETPESKQLADSAFRNRLSAVPAQQPDAPAAADDDGQVLVDAMDAPVGGAATPAAAPSSSAPAAAPAHDVHQPAHLARGPAIILTRHEETPVIPHKVVMRKVHEIFRAVDAADPLFDFEIPFVDWSEEHPGVPKHDPNYNMEFSNVLAILYAVARKKSVNLVGPHGCGKTEFIEQIAARLNFPVTTLPMDGQLTRSQMIGQEKLRATAQGNESYFATGLLPRAMREPGFINFDEIDRGVSDLQYACHSVYLQRGLTILEDGGRFVPFHPHNRVFATANTKGRGSADGMYLAAEDMSEATRDRFTMWIELEYQDADEDAKVLRAKVPGIEAWTAEIVAGIAENIRASYLEQKIAQTCSMRQQLEVADFATFLLKGERDDERRAKKLRMAFDRIILGRASDEDKGAIATLLETKLPKAYQGDPII